jgi:hypothetical protein
VKNVKTNAYDLSKRDKILIVLYEMSSGKQIVLKYEDIVVRLFKKYPEDFHLKGYPEYPDAASHQSFYVLRREGLIKIRSKFVTLTEKGITSAKQTLNEKSNLPKKSSQRLSRDITGEIDRIKNTDAFRLFATDKMEQIVDTDFFTYLGTTVRTERTDFRARIQTIEYVIETIRTIEAYKMIVDLHHYLFERFKDVIRAKLSIGSPRRNI